MSEISKLLKHFDSKTGEMLTTPTRDELLTTPMLFSAFTPMELKVWQTFERILVDLKKKVSRAVWHSSGELKDCFEKAAAEYPEMKISLMRRYVIYIMKVNDSYKGHDFPLPIDLYGFSFISNERRTEVHQDPEGRTEVHQDPEGRIKELLAEAIEVVREEVGDDFWFRTDRAARTVHGPAFLRHKLKLEKRFSRNTTDKLARAFEEHRAQL